MRRAKRVDIIPTTRIVVNDNLPAIGQLVADTAKVDLAGVVVAINSDITR